MAKQTVKKGEEVVILSGANRGKRGKVIEVHHKKQRVLVEGHNMVKKHLKKNQDHPEGAIVEREAGIHISNVMPAGRFDERQSRKQAAK